MDTSDPRWSVLAQWIADGCAMPCPWLVEVLRSGVVPGSVTANLPHHNDTEETDREIERLGEAVAYLEAQMEPLPPSALPGCQDGE